MTDVYSTHLYDEHIESLYQQLKEEFPFIEAREVHQRNMKMRHHEQIHDWAVAHRTKNNYSLSQNLNTKEKVKTRCRQENVPTRILQ